VPLEMLILEGMEMEKKKREMGKENEEGGDLD
jgi:hypothetical protein